MADSPKTNLSTLVKQLQEQVNILTTYLSAENLEEPSFLPPVDPLKSAISTLPPDIEDAKQKAYSLSWGLQTLLGSPENHLLMTIYQFFDVVALRIVMEKNIPAIIPVSSLGVSSVQISEKIGIPERNLVEILRQLASIGIFRETSPRHFAHTSTSAYLYANAAKLQDLLLHFADESYKASAYLPESVDLYASKFDEVQKPELRTAFNLGLRTDAHYFDWAYFPENVARYGNRFGRAMLGASLQIILRGDIDRYDWSQFEDGDKIVDVGGGVGHVGILVKQKVKKGVRVIIQDRPSVVEQGRAIPEHNELLEFQAHDFLTEQPVVGAKLYYLRMIMHDWPDNICRIILGHIVKAMNNESKILIFDSVRPGGEYWASGKDDKGIIESYSFGRRLNTFLSMQMMNMLGSKERVEEEWRELLRSAGLKLNAIYGSGQSDSIIEAVKA